MSRKIGIIINFLTPAYQKQIDEAAAANGFTAQYFASSEAALGNVGDCEILYGHPSRKVIQSAGNLRWFACCWAGVDRFCDDGLFPRADCLLTNASGCYGTTISEHLIMTGLMLLRRQTEYTELIRGGGWATLSGGIRSLHGSRITVLGTGDIGTEYAVRVRAFCPETLIGVCRSGRENAAFDRVYKTESLDALLPQTDVLVMALPSTPDTVGILSRERIALLPRTAIVQNVGRGTAVDQSALIEALNGDRLGGAALDVVVPEPLPADHPLRSAKNILLTPHVSGNMTLGYTCDLNVSQFTENLALYAAGQPLKHIVNRKKGY